jgi:hypothetical protein
MLLDYTGFRPACQCQQCSIASYVSTGRCPCSDGECVTCDGVGFLFGRRCDVCHATGREPAPAQVRAEVLGMRALPPGRKPAPKNNP